MSKIGIVSLSDSREFLHREIVHMHRQFQAALVARLEADGHQVVTAEDIVWRSEMATAAGRKLAAQQVDLTILNFSTWAWPHLAVLVSEFAPGPFVCLSNINPDWPGLVGMLAASGGLDNVGRTNYRVAGDIARDEVWAKVRRLIRASLVTKRLRGQTFGLFGGRPLGMYTAVSDTATWMRRFGVDVGHVDQWELVRRAEAVPAARLDQALQWCEANVGRILYDGKALTPELLKRQIAIYYALVEICREEHFDFCGVKAQPELTDNFCTMDVAEAFMNDPYDFDGPKETMVCATEADMDGALTMQIFKLLTGDPVLFADVRHFHLDLNVLDLCNSGQHPTYFAGRSLDPKVNLPRVEFHPESFCFPAGGAAVKSLAVPGEFTLARLARSRERYWMAIMKCDFVEFGSRNDEIMNRTQSNWAHAFARFDVAYEDLLEILPCNHVHGCYGDWVDDLVQVCEFLQVEPVVLGRTQRPQRRP